MDSVTVSVSPLPTVDAGLDGLICLGDSIQLMATGASSYVWSTGATTAVTTVAPTFNTTYSVAGTDAIGCSAMDSLLVQVAPIPQPSITGDTLLCSGDSTVLTAMGGTAYAWSSNDSVAQILAIPPTNTTYVVTVSNGAGCFALDSINITVNPAITVSAGNDTTICDGGTAMLIATGGTEYAWSTGPHDDTLWVMPSTTTTYYLTATDSQVCRDEDSVTVFIHAPVQADAGPDAMICLGDAAVLMASGGSSYQWSTNESTTSIAVSPTSDSTYFVTVTDANGCTGTDSVGVTVVSLSVPTISQVCAGDTIELTVDATSATGPVSYQWSPDDFLSSNSGSTVLAWPPNQTTINVTATLSTGCSLTSSITLEVSEQANASFSTELFPDCDGVTVQFTNQSTDATGIEWQFPDGSTSTDDVVERRYQYGEPVKADLTVTSADGCSTTSQHVLDLLDLADYFPTAPANVFTPNGDGMNDLLHFNLEELGDCAELQIFSRWGILVYESDPGNATWDGVQNDGQQAQDGTYIYIISVHGLQYKGTVLLTR